MKKLFYFLSVLLFCAVSCKSLPERVEDFVLEVENSYTEYSEEDWAAKEEKCADLKAEFEKKQETLEQDEKDQIRKAFLRYEVAVAKGKMRHGFDNLKETLSGVGEWVNGVVSGDSGKEGSKKENKADKI